MTERIKMMPKGSVGNVEQFVRQTITKVLGCPEEKITNNATLIGDLGCDSLTAVDILFKIEEEFNIDLDLDDEIAMQIQGGNPAGAISVGEIINSVEKALAF